VDELAALGARVILAGRDASKVESVRDELVLAHGDARSATVVVDMASRSSVRAAIEHILATEPRLDVVIDNAGAMFPTRQVNDDGLEATLATMVVGPFALIAGLLPVLDATPGARVISVTSGGQYAQGLHLDDLGWASEPWDGARAYARAKRAQVSLMREWARRTVGTGLAFFAMHPGWADTPGIAAALPGFHRLMGPILRSPAQGVDTMVWLAAEPGATELSGRLVLDRRARPFDRIPSTRVSPADRRRLWDAVVHLAGIADPIPAYNSMGAS
jgi:NAD(P)-dependent dehydrogenase (short-subunit alcohol dehydrogenase family)